MNDISKVIAQLTPEKRSLLLRRLEMEGGRFRTFPLSFAQERLWFLDQLEPGSPAYNIPLAVRITGPLQPGLLERAVNEVIRRHEALRTTFVVVSGHPVQIISPELVVPLKIIDLRSIPSAELDDMVERLALQEAERPMELAVGPLVRVTLLQLGEDNNVLLMTIHHIVSDGWSMGILIRETITLYHTFAENRPNPLVPLTRQYADFALWQREWLAGELLEREVAYWQKQLEERVTALDLPIDHQRPSILGSRGEHLSFSIPAQVADRIDRFCGGEGATRFMVLLAAFEGLLYRYTSQEQFTVGTAIANRHRAEVEDLIGFFVNTLVLPADVPNDSTFRTLLRTVRETTLGAYEHQDLPFEILVDRLHVSRDMSHAPLFQVFFELMDIPGGRVRTEGLQFEQLEVHTGRSKFDLSLLMASDGPALRGTFEYSTDLFRRETISRMAEHYRAFLTSCLEDPDRLLSEIPFLTSAERNKILTVWNGTNASFEPLLPAHRLFERQVEQRPDWPAVISGSETVTYSRLNELANRVAQRLRSSRVLTDSPVGVYAERSTDLVVSLLGILKAGGAYLPLDPSNPSERLLYILRDACPQVILCQEQLRSRLPETSAEVVLLEGDGPKSMDETPGNLHEEIEPDSLSYVIYTSGSTGKPKGSLLSHRGLSNLLLWTQGHYQLVPEDRMLMRTAHGFDVSVWEILWPLTAGATLVVAPGSDHRDTGSQIRLIREHGVTIAIFVPSFLRAFLESNSVGECGGLRMVISTGEALSTDLHDMFFRKLSATLHDLYGPTETTIEASYWPCVPEREGREIPIGFPVANTKLYVLNHRCELVPMGVVGELHIGGVQLARGYLDRPDLTAERFIPDPLSGTPGARLYRTGDLARVNRDGSIAYLGRADHQVKIRGFRIELGEIESVLLECRDVSQAVVVAREMHKNDVRLVAYLVLCDGAAVTRADLVAHLKKSLPEYMVPSVFVMLKALPLNANGKVDRRALPEPDQERVGERKTYIPPRTLVEGQLASIWEEVLGVRRIGIQDSFFDEGGHSLLVIKVQSRIRDLLGVEVPLVRLFEHPTIEALGRIVEAEQLRTELAAVPPVRPRPSGTPIPLSYSQQRLWFIDQLDPGSPMYNMPVAVRLQGALEVGVLRRCMNDIVRRHEILRTRIETVDGIPAQVVEEDLAVALSVVDVSDLPTVARESEIERIIAAESRKPFDLRMAPLFRVQLLRCAPEDHVLLFTVHHIAFDGWSTGVLIREVGALYNATLAGAPPPLGQLPIQYGDYAHWQRAWLEGAALDAGLGYWVKKLQGAPPLLDLPADRPRKPVQSSSGKRITFVLPPEDVSEIRDLGRGEDATMFVVMLAIFQCLLQRYSGQDDICVGTPVANRSRMEIESLIGFFVNTVVLRTDCSGNPTLREMVRRARAVVLESLAHQEVPFEKIVDAVAPERDMSYSPLFQAMIVMNTTPRASMELQGLRLTQLPEETGTALFDLTLTLEENEAGMSAGLSFNTDLFDHATMERFAGHFRSLVASAARNPDVHLMDVALCSESERHELLVEWNRTEKALPESTCIHALFERQADRMPRALAAFYEGEEIEFGELNRAANRLAHYLRKVGVGPESVVGLLLDRSLDLVVGILGVLKAGGAYLPLDPAYPNERIGYIIRDAGLSALVTMAAFSADVPSSDFPIILLDAVAALLQGEDDSNPDVGTTGDNLAYVIYTSGSTGRPKGVMIQHRAAVNLWQGLTHTVYGHFPEPGLRVSLNASVLFDASVQQILMLLSGHSLFIIPQRMRTDGAALVQYVQRHRLDSLDCVPSQLKLMLDEGLLNTEGWVPRVILPGGEAIDRHLWEAIAHAPRTEFYNMYGPTECTVDSTICPVNLFPSMPSIGRPINNVRHYILDALLEPVPVGVSGELYIGGAGVARGYLNRPDLTAENFLPDPHAEFPGSRIYRTGDRVRYRPDGTIEYLGRQDAQVKIRGFRIEPGEIEAVLEQHGAVQEATVVAREDRQGMKRLVAYIAVEEGNQPSRKELRDHLRSKVPDYMIPATFVFLAAIPKTPNGKVDRLALPAPEAERSEEDGIHIPPSTETERVLVDVWGVVLQLTKVGIRDNFFELGGDSILAIQVIAKARQRGIHINPRQLFQHPTIEQLALVATAGPSLQADQGEVTGSAPLTPIQRWFFDAVSVNRNHWNQSILLELLERVDPATVREAIRLLMSHHDALRLRVAGSEDSRVLEFRPTADEEVFRSIDLTSVPSDDRVSELEEEAAAIQGQLDIAHGPLVRAVLFDLGPRENLRLLLVIHHLAVDGVSWRILLEDLQTLLVPGRQGPAQLPPKTSSFKTWAERISRYAQSPLVHEQVGYWRVLPGETRALLPRDMTGGENSERSAKQVNVELGEEETTAVLRDVPPVYGTEINEVLLAALSIALADWAGSKVQTVDLEGHGRELLFEDIDVTRTVGWFTTIYPVRIDIRVAKSDGELLKCVKEQLRSVPSKGIAYLAAKYSSERGADLLPQSETSFNYLGQIDQAVPAGVPVKLARESSGPQRSPDGLRPYVIDMSALVSGGRLRISFTYSTNLHREQTIAALANAYLAGLRRLITHCQSPGAGGYTPSDFALAGLDQAKLDKVLGKVQRSLKAN